MNALVELRVPFDLNRQQIDDVERGANDSDWQPAKDAARLLAFAEDRAIFDGYAAAGIGGIRQGTSNPVMTLPADVREYPDVIAQAVSQLRLVGVNGPYSVLLSADAYTALSETRDHGYPVLEHIKRLVDGELVWAPAIAGAFVLTTRGGDLRSEAAAAFTELTPTEPDRARSEMGRLVGRALAGTQGELWLLEDGHLVRRAPDGGVAPRATGD